MIYFACLCCLAGPWVNSYLRLITHQLSRIRGVGVTRPMCHIIGSSEALLAHWSIVKPRPILKGCGDIADGKAMEVTIPSIQRPIPSDLMELTTFIYVSSAVQLFSSQDLADLLKRARDKNSRLGITGMLLYKDGNFMQAIEGPDQAVRDLYSTIALDTRHRGAMKLIDYPIKERQFAEWTMGFRNLDGVRPVDGFSEILSQPFNSAWFSKDPTRAQKVLLSFCKNM
jgi:hypothetical protein